MKLSVRRISIIGMLGALSIILGLTPLGFIPIPFSLTKATIMHIPVIIGAVIEGPLVGAFVGLIFGVFSMYQAAVMPTSPVQVVFLDPVVAVLPRILIGLASYYTYVGVKKLLITRMKSDIPAVMVAAIVGTATNTLGVLSLIYARHLATFAEKLSLPVTAAKGILIGIGTTQGIPETIVAVIIVTAVVRGIQKLNRQTMS